MQVENTNKASPKMDHQTDLMPEAKAFALYSFNSRFLYSFFFQSNKCFTVFFISVIWKQSGESRKIDKALGP